MAETRKKAAKKAKKVKRSAHADGEETRRGKVEIEGKAKAGGEEDGEEDGRPGKRQPGSRRGEGFPKPML